MSYYKLNKQHIDIDVNEIKIKVKLKNDDVYEKSHISKSVEKYLSRIKNNINKYPNQWDNFKKISNPYEYIHTNIPKFKTSISEYIPVSRAFFKFVEIYNQNQLNEYFCKPIKSFHLAEGPGGFIEAINHVRSQNPRDLYYGITLIEDSQNIPNWNKLQSLIDTQDNIIIENGLDGTGDLFNPNNYNDLKEKYMGTMDLITADGGFDFSVNFNHQETQALRLLLTEVIYTFMLQKNGGVFIFKMFDTFKKASIDIIYLLSCFYEKINVVKPNTSRYANSEKYIVCKNFNYEEKNLQQINQKLYNILYVINKIDFNDFFIHSILDLNYNLHFKNQIEELNIILANQQIENIQHTIRLIENNERKNEKLQQLQHNNIQKCIQWCLRNNMKYNRLTQTTNIFKKNLLKV